MNVQQRGNTPLTRYKARIRAVLRGGIVVGSRGNPMASPGRASDVVRFDVFQVDLRAGALYQAGRKIKLQIQPFHTLALLLERPGEVITREEFQKKLWLE